MKFKLLPAVVVTMLFCQSIALSAQDKVSQDYLRAVDLYEHGMFERAGSLFGKLYASNEDVLAKGYEVLCAVRLQEVGCQTMADNYTRDYPYSKIIPQIHFYTALNQFDSQDYVAALNTFELVNEKSLYGEQVPEYTFKKAYSFFEGMKYDEAYTLFERSEKMPQSDYTAPSRYSLGYIDYLNKNFSQACKWFEKSSKDPRFTELSEYYILECHFMQKDYDFVLKNGIKAYDNAPKERQPHMARIISESYLAKGNSSKAKEYYEKITGGTLDMDRNDFFYAGSVYYAVEDYKGAIENYSRITDRTDSIGQIANYQLAYSYIQTGSKVNAMDSFKAASESKFNPDIQEDAFLNYAKLSFDLNHNASVFNSYISKYPNKKNNDMIYSYMALASMYNHDYAGAVEAYSNIDMLDNDQKANYMRANYLRAHELIENSSWTSAVPLLNAASFYSDKRDPFNQLSRYWMAESYFRSDQFDKAIDAFTSLYNISALEGKSEGKLIPYDLAYSYFRKGDYDNAAKWFDKYLKSTSLTQGEDAAVRRADCDFVKKDYKTAIAGYESAISRFSYKDNLYPFYQTGIAYGLEGQMSKKIEVLSKTLSSSPSAKYYSEALYELGRAYVASDKNDDAINCFKRLKNESKDKSITAKALIELGMISRNLSEYEQALNYYKQVIAEMPGTEYAEDALLAIESIYQSDGRTQEYLNYAEKIGVGKDRPESEKETMFFNAAEQLYLGGNYEKALASFQNYIERYPQGIHSANADFYVAESYKNLGKKEQACEWYKKSLEKNDVGSFAEIAMLNFSKLSFDLQRYSDSYGGYTSLLQKASIENNRHTAVIGMMNAAFAGQEFQNAISASQKVRADKKSSADELRKASYVIAKSNLSLNNRSEAMAAFKELSLEPSTKEGAEASVMVIQDAYDNGEFEKVESLVYKFSEKAGAQSYWLAKAFIILGDSFAERDNYSQAKATFESVLNGYKPAEGTSDEVLDNVKMRLEKLNNIK